jgi:PKD repeat protein
MKQFSKLMLTIRVPVSSVLISLALLFVLTVPGSNSASAQTTQTPQIAYVQYSYITNNCCPPGGGACDAFCPDPYLETFTVVTPFGGTNGSYDTQPTWSADGTKIAFTRNNDISVADANGANAVSITNTANNQDPAWSPAGARIAFMTTRDGHSELYLMNPDGSNVVRLTYNVGFSVGHPAWSRDGARIAFNCQVVSGNDDICAINPDGTGFVRLTTDPASDSGPTWSPDGMSIAFSTTRYGPALVIAVMNADGSGVSQVGAGVQGGDPAWSPDGAEIAFDVPAYDLNGNYSPIIYTMKADGTAVALFVSSADEPAWMPAHVPVATFKLTCNGLTCNFDASGSKDSYGTITSYAWNFGDGTTGAGVSLAHTYTGSGTYTVKLTVTDNTGATGTKIQPVIIGPIASFTFACSGLTCNFDGSGSKDFSTTITHYAWNFGDGASGAGVTTGHTYALGGAYNVTLTVTDSIGASSSQSKSVIVNIAPVASFAFACNLLTCSFDGSGSHDPDGTITSYAWNFGDGTTGSGVTASHMYVTGGTYTVTLTVTDNAGATNTQSQTVIANSPPVASFTFSCSQLTCYFDGSASRDSDGTVTSYAWKFGDGATGSGVTTTHTYAAAGTYVVTLTVTDNGGATGTQSNNVTVVHRR